MTNTTRAVVLFSGGMDSTVCLYEARPRFADVQAVAIDYGQRHAEREILAARRIAAKLEIPLTLYTMRIDWNATLCALSRPLRAGTDDEGVSHAFVPGRNLHMLTVAGAHACRFGASVLVIGCCADDADAFPDCRRSFIAAAAGAVSQALARTFTIQAPLVERYKRDVVRAASPELRALIDESWSCYTPTHAGEPCDACDACTLRAKALAA